jgi:hypothetical protein
MKYMGSCPLNRKHKHTKRQATQHDCLPSLLGDGDKEIEKVYGEEKIFCTGPTRTAKSEQKISCTGTASPTNQPRKDRFHLYSLSPHSPQFQQSAGTIIYIDALKGGPCTQW